MGLRPNIKEYNKKNQRGCKIDPGRWRPKWVLEPNMRGSKAFPHNIKRCEEGKGAWWKQKWARSNTVRPKTEESMGTEVDSLIALGLFRWCTLSQDQTRLWPSDLTTRQSNKIKWLGLKLLICTGSPSKYLKQTN